MKFDLSKIKLSNNDIKRNISIPTNLTPKLAEFLGIIVGDGHVACYRNKPGLRTYIDYQIRITGNVKDYNYYSRYVNNLINDLFSIRFNLKTYSRDNSVMMSKDSKALFYFLSEYFNIPKNKDNIRIPKQICNGSMVIKSSFLKGLADADFTLTIKQKEGKPYPFIQGSSKSKELIKDFSKIVDEFSIKHSSFMDTNYSKKRQKYYTCYRININGIKNIKKWFSKIGFSNPRHLQKFNNFLNNAPEGTFKS